MMEVCLKESCATYSEIQMSLLCCLLLFTHNELIMQTVVALIYTLGEPYCKHNTVEFVYFIVYKLTNQCFCMFTLQIYRVFMSRFELYLWNSTCKK